MDARLEEMYSRQNDLFIVPHEATVIGVGGIGFWVAVNLAMSGVGSIKLLDGDTLNAVNLNRIPADASWLGKKKVDFCKHFISQFRPDALVIAIGSHYSEEIRDIVDSHLILECVDNGESQLSIDKNFSGCHVFHIHYNGYERISVENFVDKNEWGEMPSHYDVVQSSVSSAMAAAGIGTFMALSEFTEAIGKNRIKKIAKSIIL